VLGRSGKAYADWLRSRGSAFTAGIGTATLDPFRGYGNAVRDELDDAVAVLDAFHVVRLGLKAMEETRRRVQQQQLGHRGRKRDPLYRIRNPLRAGAERLSARQIERIEAGLQAGDPTFEVTVAWRCYQQLRSAFGASSLVEGRAIAVAVLDSFPTCPIPEIARLGRTLNAWKQQFLAYFTTQRANNGGTEAINGIIELHRRIARGFRNPAVGPLGRKGNLQYSAVADWTGDIDRPAQRLDPVVQPGETGALLWLRPADAIVRYT
jgi:transposase